MKNHLHIEKIKDIAHYIAKKSSNDLYITKFLKLFYYVDFISVLERGENVSGDAYYRLPYGPIPSFVKDQLKILIKAENVIEKDFFGDSGFENSKSIFDGVISMQEVSLPSSNKANKLSPAGERDYSNLSDYEKALLDDIVSEYDNKTTAEVVAKTHTEPPYANTQPGNIVDFKYAFMLDLKSILPNRPINFDKNVSLAEFSSEF